MILHQKNSSDAWFSWDTKTMTHYYPSIRSLYKLLGPTKWDLRHNLKKGTIALAPDVLGGWEDGKED